METKNYKYDVLSTRLEFFNEQLQDRKKEGWIVAGEPSVYRMDLRNYLKVVIKKEVKL